MNINELKKHTEGPCVIVMVGSSGSGKSTLARELAVEDHEVISSDHYREVLCGDVAEQSLNSVVFQMIYDIIKKRSTFRCRSILDSTNLRRRDRKAYYGPVAKGLPTYAILVDTPESVCKERQHRRDRQVPEFVVEKHARRFAQARQDITHEVEKWTGIFRYDSETEEVEILR